jgi:hypothetical protein
MTMDNGMPFWTDPSFPSSTIGKDDHDNFPQWPPHGGPHNPPHDPPPHHGEPPCCFVAGTLILTPTGELPVESLRIGDFVVTNEGAIEAIRWVGVQRISKDKLSFETMPIRISAGALGNGAPTRDLWLSADHALFIDGVLIQAGALVNDVSIVREHRTEEFIYYHIELESHRLIKVEGVPAETFIDNVTRMKFDNWSEFFALYGQEGDGIKELNIARAKSYRQIPQKTKARLGMGR